MHPTQKYSFFLDWSQRFSCCEESACKCEPYQAALTLIKQVGEIPRCIYFHNPDNLIKLAEKIKDLKSHCAFGANTEETLVKCEEMIVRFRANLQGNAWIKEYLQQRYKTDAFTVQLSYALHKQYSVTLVDETNQQQTLLIPNSSKERTLAWLAAFDGYLKILNFLKKPDSACTLKTISLGQDVSMLTVEEDVIYINIDSSKKLEGFISLYISGNPRAFPGENNDGLLRFEDFEREYNQAILEMKTQKFRRMIAAHMPACSDLAPFEISVQTSKIPSQWIVYFTFCDIVTNKKESKVFDGKEQELIPFVRHHLTGQRQKLIEYLKSVFKERLVEKKQPIKLTNHDEFFIAYDEDKILENLTAEYYLLNSNGHLESLRIQLVPQFRERSLDQCTIIHDFHLVKKMLEGKTELIEWIFEKTQKDPPKDKVRVSPDLNNRDKVTYEYVDENTAWRTFTLSKELLIKTVKAILLNRKMVEFTRQLNQEFGVNRFKLDTSCKNDADFTIVMREEDPICECDLFYTDPVNGNVICKTIAGIDLKSIQQGIRNHITQLKLNIKNHLESIFDNRCYEKIEDVPLNSFGVVFSLHDAIVRINTRRFQGSYHITYPVNFQKEKCQLFFNTILNHFMNPLIFQPFVINIDRMFTNVRIVYDHPYLNLKRVFGCTIDRLPIYIEEVYQHYLQLLEEKKEIALVEPSVISRQNTLAQAGVPLYLEEGNPAHLMALFTEIIDPKIKDYQKYQQFLQEMITAIMENKPHWGAPENEEERRLFFETLKCYLSHIIVKLKGECDPLLKKNITILFIEASTACAGRWAGEVMQHYNTLFAKTSNKLFEYCFGLIDKIKLGIIEEMSKLGGAHTYLMLCRQLAAVGIGIPGSAVTDFEDPFPDAAIAGHIEATRQRFMNLFVPPEMTTIVMQNLNRELLLVKNPFASQIITELRTFTEKELEPEEGYKKVKGEYFARKAVLEAAEDLKPEFINALIERGRSALGNQEAVIPVLDNEIGRAQLEIYTSCLEQLIAALEGDENEESCHDSLNWTRNDFANKIKVLRQELLDAAASKHRNQLDSFLDETLQAKHMLQIGDDGFTLQLTRGGVIALLLQLGLFSQK